MRPVDVAERAWRLGNVAAILIELARRKAGDDQVSDETAAFRPNPEAAAVLTEDAGERGDGD